MLFTVGLLSYIVTLSLVLHHLDNRAAKWMYLAAIAAGLIPVTLLIGGF